MGVLIPLCTNKTFTTLGQTSGNEAVYICPAGRANTIGPLASQLRIHWEGSELTTQFRTKVQMSWSISGKTWSTPVELLSTRSADGQVISTSYSTTSEFGPLWRFEMLCWNGSGSNIESGIITAVLEVTLKS